MPISCRDACGKQVADMQEALAKAWQHLEIQKRWRCPDCFRDLRNVDTLRNKEGDNA